MSNHTTHLYPSLSNLHAEDEEVSKFSSHVKGKALELCVQPYNSLYPSLSNLHVEDEEVDELMLHMLKDHVAHLHVLQPCQLFHGQDKVGIGVLLEPFLYTHGSSKSSHTAGKSPYKTSTNTKQANDPHKADKSSHRASKPQHKVGR